MPQAAIRSCGCCETTVVTPGSFTLAPMVISESLDDQDELFLLHCDDNWNVLGIQAWNAIDDPDVATPNDVKTRAENYYAGISSQWIAHGTTVEDARAYHEQMIGEHRCSF